MFLMGVDLVPVLWVGMFFGGQFFNEHEKVDLLV
jgi:hypothetical protein